MKKFTSVIFSPAFITAMALLLIALLIWFAGPYTKFGESNTAPLASTTARLVCILILVGIWGLNNLRIQWRAKKQNNSLVDDIQKNQKETTTGSSSQVVEEIQQINQRFGQALATLKKRKFGGNGQKALYELPWYIIVGPPGSGKTTALVNSGLDFPLAEKFGKGALQGVGGTRNCDWWFTNEAVLIDTAGRYTTQDSHRVVDSSAWEGFLGLLKRNRRRRPINGAVVAISLQDLLIQTEDERIQNAKTIRSRLDELMQKLQIRFPVYLMFTKSDLVSGFSEFFEDLNRDDREQVWGVSLPNAPKANQSPNFDYISEQLDQLTERLYDRVLWRMHQERDPKRRGAIYGFPQQMENLQNLVDSFTRQTFSQNRYQFQPYLRGVYFSSGTQDGTPIDRLMSSVSANFGFARDSAQLAQQQGKSFFLSRLFRDVVFPESELVGSNIGYERFIRWAQRATYATLAVVMVATGLVWSGALTRQTLSMNEVNGYLEEFSAEEKKVKDWNKDVRVVLPPLNALAKASIVYDQEEHPWLSGMGLYDSRIDEKANKAYELKLRELLLPRLVDDLERALKQGHKGGDLYNTFRIYMMFERLDKMEPELVKEWFHAQWDAGLQGEATRRQQLKAHLDQLLALPLAPLELNQRLVADTRTTLLRVPVSQRIYERAKNNPEYGYPVDMLNQFGESVRSYFKTEGKTLSIPALYTIGVYENLDFSAESPLIADIENERWLLAQDEKERVDFIQEDLGEISKEVKELYLAEYASTWARLFKNLDVKSFSSINQVNDALMSFADPVYSPLRAILQVGKEHTQLTMPVLQDLAAGDEGNSKSKMGRLKSFAASKVETTRVDKQFRELHLMLHESRSGLTPVDGAMQKVQQLQEFVSEVAMSPDPAKKSFDIAKARFQSGGGNAITSLRAYAKNQPEPVERWLTTLADETWKVILGSARQYVNVEWNAQVYTSYRQGLAGRYPLNGGSADEMAMFDFAAFFKPAGTLDLFYKDYIAAFIDTRKNWSNKVVDKYSIGFSNKTLRQVRRGLNIKNVLFRTNAETPEIQLELRPYRMKENHARFVLELGDERLIYKHGPKFWKNINWSGASDNNRIRVIFEDLNDAVHDRSFTGPWSWFHLMDSADIEKTNRANVYNIGFKVMDGNNEQHRILYQGKAKSVNNPMDRSWLTSFRCPESI
ncbi:type VI secretion system membrane subunit TssM [Teredinibacter franksiae]|uniref:type VI secretion system membrane subunit TssM n=1 Tax=Teredinibacter franksiae TaxID=2761453 RepID=UPI0016252188|nr:type VI secretion system membrane subunit TssM [Teredinibacter franksiae]